MGHFQVNSEARPLLEGDLLGCHLRFNQASHVADSLAWQRPRIWILLTKCKD